MDGFLENVPEVDAKRILSWVYPGPEFKQIVVTPGINFEDQKIFEKWDAIPVLKEYLDHYFLGKFLGPWPKWVKTIDGQPINIIRTFVIRKADWCIQNPKCRVLINASEEYSNWQDFQPSDSDPDFIKFRNSKPIKSFNDALIKITCSLPGARAVIRKLYVCKLL